MYNTIKHGQTQTHSTAAQQLEKLLAICKDASVVRGLKGWDNF